MNKIKFSSFLFLLALLLGCCAISSAAHAQEVTPLLKIKTKAAIIASDYCAFLNAVAPNDPYHFYDEKMGSDAAAACIIRSGMPGDYSYSVIQGKENFPIYFVSSLDAIHYSSWKDHDAIVESFAPSFSIIDELLKSSQLPAINAENKAEASSSAQEEPSSFKEGLIGVAALTALFSMAPSYQGAHGVELNRNASRNNVRVIFNDDVIEKHEEHSSLSVISPHEKADFAEIVPLENSLKETTIDKHDDKDGKQTVVKVATARSTQRSWGKTALSLASAAAILRSIHLPLDCAAAFPLADRIKPTATTSLLDVHNLTHLFHTNHNEDGVKSDEIWHNINEPILTKKYLPPWRATQTTIGELSHLEIQALQSGNDRSAEAFRQEREQLENALNPYTNAYHYSQETEALLHGKTSSYFDWQNPRSYFFAAAEETPGEESFLREEIDRHDEAAAFATAEAFLARNSGKVREEGYWNDAVSTHVQIIEALTKAINLDKAGNHALALKWRKLASHHDAVASALALAVKALAAKNEKEADSYFDAALAYRNVARSFQQAIELESAEDSPLALKWHEITDQYRDAASTFAQSLRTKAYRKSDEIDYWGNAALHHTGAAQTMELELAGTNEYVHEIANKHNAAASAFTEAAKAAAEGKKMEAAAYSNAAISYKKASTYLNHANTVTKLALRYREIVNKYDEAASAFMETARATAQEKTKEANFYRHLALFFADAAKTLITATELEEGGSHEEALKYHEVANKYNIAVVLIKKAIDAIAIGEKEAADNYAAAAEIYIEGTTKIIDALKLEKQGNHKKALKYPVIISKYDDATVALVKAAEAELQKETDQAYYWHDIAFQHHGIAINLLEATTEDDHEALKYRDIANKHEAAASAFIKAIEAIEVKQIQKSHKYSAIGLSYREAAGNLRKAIEMERAGNSDEALKHRKIAAKHDSEATALIQKIQTRMESNSTNTLNNHLSHFINSSESTHQTKEAVNNTTLARTDL